VLSFMPQCFSHGEKSPGINFLLNNVTINRFPFLGAGNSVESLGLHNGDDLINILQLSLHWEFLLK
jgi:hypothetical protein